LRGVAALAGLTLFWRVIGAFFQHNGGGVCYGGDQPERQAGGGVTSVSGGLQTPAGDGAAGVAKAGGARATSTAATSGVASRVA